MASQARARALRMTRRSAGIVLTALGGLLLIIGVVGMVTSGDDSNGAIVAPSTTTESLATASTTLSPSTTSTTAATTTTSVAATTTTTIDVVSEVETFVPTFADAIAREDIDYLYDTLHPVVTTLFEEDLCRTFIEAEILLLEDYRLTGDVTGPSTENIGGQVVETYRGPVAFGFQGQDFETGATFAYEQSVRWFTECR